MRRPLRNKTAASGRAERIKTMEIEESGGRRRFCMDVEGRIREYEKRTICGSDCPYALPMHFVAEGETEKAYYDFTGYLQIADHIRRQVSDNQGAIENQNLVSGALEMLSDILKCLKGMELYLIFPERVTIHPDLIFIDSNCGRAALAFYPDENPETPLQNRILFLIDQMSALYSSAEIDQYLKKMKEFILAKNPGLDGMIAFLGTVQREVSYIYWHSADFRTEERKETEREHESEDRNKPFAGIMKRIMRGDAYD